MKVRNIEKYRDTFDIFVNVDQSIPNIFVKFCNLDLIRKLLPIYTILADLFESCQIVRYLFLSEIIFREIQLKHSQPFLLNEEKNNLDKHSSYLYIYTYNFKF